MQTLIRPFLPYFVFVAVLSIGLEILLLRERATTVYDKKESWISVAIFFAGAAVNGGFRVLTGGALVWAYQYRILEPHFSPAVNFALAFLGTEFLYYWMHRYSHEVRLGWTSHIVHHSPECFNFSVAYRLGVTNFFSFLWVFYVPLAFVGFDPKTIAICVSLNLFYQFWLHTELIPKLGMIEWVLNTPSHHRIHHASNPIYLDRNYGGTLIVFDRLFGTFQAEDPTVRIEYGLTEKIRNKGVIRVSFLGWTSLAKDFRKYPGFKNAFLFLIRKPGWTPAGSVTSADLRRNFEIERKAS